MQTSALQERIAYDGAVTFFAAGVARPKGSHRAFVVPGKGGARARAVMAGMGKDEKGWRGAVSSAAHEAMARLAPFEGGVVLELEFYTQRPKGHFRTNGELRPLVQPRPTRAPDADKLARSVGDALNGIAYRDDSQVVELVVRKLYTTAAQPHVGVRVTVRPYVGA